MNAETTVPAGNDVMVANDLTALPPEPVATTDTAPPAAEPAPAPRSSGGFRGGDRSRRSGGAYGPAAATNFRRGVVAEEDLNPDTRIMIPLL